MTLIRRRMRLWAAIWMVFQVALLSAFVPRDCCAAHKLMASHKAHASQQADAPACHETAAPAEESGSQSSMPDSHADGASCPLHRDGVRGTAAPGANPCGIRGTCDGPMAALATLLSNHGVLTDSFVLSPDFGIGSPAVPLGENPIRRLASPDAPPPRA